MSLQDRSRRKGMEVIENASDEQQEFISGTSSSQSKGGSWIDRVCSVLPYRALSLVESL